MNNKTLIKNQVTSKRIEVDKDLTLYVAPSQSEPKNVFVEDTELKSGHFLTVTNKENDTFEVYIVTDPNESKEFIKKKITEGYEVSFKDLVPVNCQITSGGNDWLTVKGSDFKLGEGEKSILSGEELFFNLLTDFEIEEDNKIILNGFCGMLELKDFSPVFGVNNGLDFMYQLDVKFLAIISNNNYFYLF